MKEKLTKKIYKAVPLLSGIEEIRNDFEERIAQGDCKYGIEIFDDCVETVRKGSTTFIIAAPNVGKSLWGLKIATNFAEQGKKVLICSCEMGAGLLMERELRTHLGVSMQTLKDTYIHRRDTANKLMDSLIEDERFDYYKNISICETGGATIEDILELVNIESPDCVIVDYIQRVKGSGSEYENITYAAREIQSHGRATGTIYIVCSQANRQSNDEGKFGRTPDGGRIRGKGSGSIEEDADVGLTLMELIEGDQKKILATLFKNRYGDKKNIAYKYRLDARLNLILEGKNVQ